MSAIYKDGHWYGAGGGGGTTDYSDLTNKPSINNVELNGSKSLSDLGITASGLGLGNVVNTGDSAYPMSSGTTKFTTGGAYTELQKRDKDIEFYGTCSTAASTTAKTVSTSRTPLYTSLTAGLKVAVKFTYGNTASAPTLKLNSLTAKAIKYIDNTGSAVVPTNWWNAGDVVTFIYDGTQWLIQPTFGGVGVDKMPAEDMPEIVTPLPGVMSRRMVYSTDEQVVGEWIDGKPIYQKTFTGTATFNNWIANISSLPSSCDLITNIFGVVKNTNGNMLACNQSELLVYYNADTTQQIQIVITDQNAVYLNCTYYITIQYTKTTDTAIS